MFFNNFSYSILYPIPDTTDTPAGGVYGTAAFAENQLHDKCLYTYITLSHTHTYTYHIYYVSHRHGGQGNVVVISNVRGTYNGRVFVWNRASFGYKNGAKKTYVRA